MQQKIASTFCQTFLLSNEEISCLNTAIINPAFFAALSRTHTVRANAKHLLQVCKSLPVPRADLFTEFIIYDSTLVRLPLPQGSVNKLQVELS